MMNNFHFIDEYIPESNEVDIELLKQSPHLRKKRYVDALFFGEIIDSKRHGRGFEKYQNGNIYLGAFDKGKAHGQGHYTWKATGEVYDGEWVRGVRHGYGVWKNLKGDSYIG
jgi:hypothetical protein